MELGQVVGNVWATKKDENLKGEKLLMVQSLTIEGRKRDQVTVATDLIGAGIGDRVLVVFGGSARFSGGNEKHPVDAAIVGIVDSIVVEEPS